MAEEHLKEKIHFKLDIACGSYRCLNCGRRFPYQYYPKNYQPLGKKYGTNQLMRLWAWYNFKRHLKKCFGQNTNG